ncbi:glutathione S-transferase/GST-like protein [Sphingobium xanthum]|jgi:GST-like protein|uniref:glutathione S-transferase family protein n=1 Tax=Sphingobium xanthum TaxID=1387165 RepID=UPI001C8B83C7|nr:glutathione S-transferase family protein [Sphingobium xanthum]
MSEKPVLYHWEPNANSGKPMLALEEKGVAYDSVYIDMLEFDQHRPDYLEINPMGTIPAMVHDGHLLNESTAIMEYVDARFDGPKLRPDDAAKRWKMRWWMKYCDQYYAPSASMVAWDMFTGPAVRNKDPDELRARIEAIPLRERRIAWTKAIYGQFSEEELAESRRRVMIASALFEDNLRENDWVAGDQFSLADINAFNLVYILPHMADTMRLPSVSVERTPRTMKWLQRMYQRPSIRRTWAHSRGGMHIDIEAEANREFV